MSTHYSLKVIRLEDLQWKHLLHRKDPKFFVELSIGNVTKRTRTAERSRSPTWNEVITFLASFEIIDALSELHPFVSIVWSLTSALYKAVKNVFQADKKYTSHSFVGRMLEADKSQKIDRFIRTLAKLKNDIDSGVNIHTAVVSMRTVHGVDKLLLHQYLNPGHFDAFEPVSLFVYFLEFPLGLSCMMQASHPFCGMPVSLHPCLPCQLC
ncbi:hypothetical protein ACEPAI_1987 [Sanghuangporus weigelae]